MGCRVEPSTAWTVILSSAPSSAKKRAVTESTPACEMVPSKLSPICTSMNVVWAWAAGIETSRAIARTAVMGHHPDLCMIPLLRSPAAPTETHLYGDRDFACPTNMNSYEGRMESLNATESV